MTEPAADPEGIRLQKVLAAAGVASRRASEILISAGRVSVNGLIVKELGTRVRPDQDVVRVDGQRITVAPGQVHLVLNKPRGVVTTMHDEHGRPCVGDLVAGQGTGLFHAAPTSRPSSRSSSMKAATTWSGGCARRSGTRSAGSPVPGSARSGWARSPAGSSARWSEKSFQGCTDSSACRQSAKSLHRFWLVPGLPRA
jgi:hypothetical protein